MVNKKSSRIYQINDILQWRNAGDDGLILSPNYQRNQVWNEKAKSYLIDSIIRDFPIPPIFIRQIIDSTTKQTYREIIDGQQRVRAILEFIDGEYKISKSHNKEFGGCLYNGLPTEMKDQILDYEIFVEIINEKDDAKIYDMFARLNSNNMALNNQEIRNAKYWGEFKVFIYDYAINTRDFFLKYDVFKEKQIARMLDVEFLSTLVILLLEGIVSENRIYIDKQYEKYDQSFDKDEEIKEKLDFIFEIITKVFDYLGNNIILFKRKVYFFTFFAFLAFQFYGMPQLEEIELKKYPKYDIDHIKTNLKGFCNVLMRFESLYDQSNNDNIESTNFYSEFIKFESYHRKRTTSKNERIERISFLNKFFEEL